MKMKTYVVLGLGRFGQSVAKTLYESGYDVLAIDKNEDIVQGMSNFVTHAVVGNVSDENLLNSLGVRNFDVAVVGIGDDLESSLLVTVILKEMGVKYIVAKAQTDLHAKVLQKVGVDKIIFPERDMGIRVASSLVQSNILDYIEISPNYSIIETSVPKKWVGKSLKMLDIRAKQELNILAVKRDEKINISPDSDDILQTDDILVILGSPTKLNKIESD